MSDVQRQSALRGFSDGLPLAWQAALRYCPFCSGTGSVEDGRECLNCEGSGDLFGAYLRAAYKLGQEDALFLLRRVRDTAMRASELADERDPDVRLLKTRLGV